MGRTLGIVNGGNRGMSYEDNKPTTYPESFRRNFHALMENMHTSMPGVIETYLGNRICSVKPQVQKKLNDGTYLDLPIIEEVPVIFPGGTDFGMTWPLKKGDPVLIIFAERSIEEWITLGGNAKPEDVRRFSLTDAIAIPGLANNKTVFPVSNNEDFKITYGTSTINITKAGVIELNGNTKPFVTHAELDAALQAFKTSLEASITGTVNAGILAHTHVETGGTTAPGVGTVVSATPPATVDISAAATTTTKTGG